MLDFCCDLENAHRLTFGRKDICDYTCDITHNHGSNAGAQNLLLSQEECLSTDLVV